MNRSKEQIYYEDIVPLMSKIIDICEEHDIEMIGSSGFCAPAEREAEKATVSAEPFGYFRLTHFGWEDCAKTDDGAIPLYTAPQPDRVAELAAKIGDLEDSLCEARRGPWEEWAEKILKSVRDASGYDGFDDGEDGVNLPREVDGLIDEYRAACDHRDESRKESDRLTAEVERLRGLLSGLVDDIQVLMIESEGVSGLHLNGDLAPWSELEAGGRFERLTHLPAAALAGKEV